MLQWRGAGAEANGTAKQDAPQWCRDSWCWIDAANCHLPIKSESTYFPKSGLVYVSPLLFFKQVPQSAAIVI